MTRSELENCIEEYGRDVYAFCRFLTRDRQEADELYQNTFLRAVEYRGRIDIQENPKGYLLSMAARLWKDKQRKDARRQRIAPRQAFVEGFENDVDPDIRIGEGEEKSPEDTVLGRETRLQVRQAVAALPEKYRLVVILYYMEELDVAQIAQVLKLPPGTVKSRLFQARKQLKKKLECIYDD